MKRQKIEACLTQNKILCKQKIFILYTRIFCLLLFLGVNVVRKQKTNFLEKIKSNFACQNIQCLRGTHYYLEELPVELRELDFL